MVNASLAEQKLPPAHFIDAGIRFTAIVQHPAEGPLTTYSRTDAPLGPTIPALG
jgi:hypothetical protein